MTRADNSHHLISAAHTRSRATRERSQAALQAMTRDGEQITFETVAAKAGVSRSWLYSAIDLRDRIIELRATTRPTPTPNPNPSPTPRHHATETSLLTPL